MSEKTSIRPDLLKGTIIPLSVTLTGTTATKVSSGAGVNVKYVKLIADTLTSTSVVSFGTPTATLYFGKFSVAGQEMIFDLQAMGIYLDLDDLRIKGQNNDVYTGFAVAVNE